jgi:hypothetical protein
VMMPGMSGWEVCRKIREDIALAHTAIIMLTGIGENLNELTSPLYGADSYIDKPFAFPELDEKVRGALTKRRGSKPGLARTEPDAPEKKNGNGGHERNLLSPPERSPSESPETGEEVDDSWPQEATGQTNGADESIMLVPTGSSMPQRRRKSSRAPSKKPPKAKASAKKTSKPKPSKAPSNGKAKLKAKSKAKPKAAAKTKSKPKPPPKKAAAKPSKKARRR